MRTVLSIILILTALTGTSQITGKNELKLNALYLFLGIPEISYESITKNSNGLGISISIATADYETIPFRYMIIPYYRFYANKYKAAGFFFEGSVALVNQKTDEFEIVLFSDQPREPHSVKSITSPGLGIAIGGKWIDKNEFFGELVFGFGYLAGTDSNANLDYLFTPFYPRLGINIGKRF